MANREPLGGNQDWMSRLPEQLLDIPLWDLAIPGSHDSVSYCLDGSSPLLRSQPALLRLSDRLCPCWTRPCVERWATTQQVGLGHQCHLGVRFLDLRIAKKPKSEDLFFAHGLYTLSTVKEALMEVSQWLEAHPREVLLLCCSHFESMTERDHQDLLSFIKAEFSTKICSSLSIPTLNTCWSRGHQVIISYDDQQVVLKHRELWPSFPYRYADSSDPQKVIAYLNQQKLRGRPARFFVSGLNLTEDAAYVLTHPRQDMRKMTTKALKLLLGWTAEQRPGPESDAVNIVCCDFVDVGVFCSLVIGLNYYREPLLAPPPVCTAPIRTDNAFQKTHIAGFSDRLLENAPP